MIREVLEVRFPVRVHRPVQITESTHPLRKFLPGLSSQRLRRPVNHDQPRPILHERIEFLEMRIQEVPFMTGAEYDNRRCVFENLRVLRITVLRQNDRLDPEIRFVESFG